MFQDKVTALLKMSQYKSEAMKQIDELMRHIGDLERELDNWDLRNKESTEKVDKYFTELKELWRKNDDLEVEL